MTRRLTSQDEDAVIEAYRQWDQSTPVEDLVEALGVSKQTLYQVLGRRGEPLKSWRGRPDGATGGSPTLLPEDLMTMMADRALGFLVDQVTELRQRNAELTARLEELEGITEAGQ